MEYPEEVPGIKAILREDQIFEKNLPQSARFNDVDHCLDELTSRMRKGRDAMRETDQKGLNKQSPQTLTDEQIVTEKTIPRRSFLAATGAVLLGGAASLVLGNTAGAQTHDPDKPRNTDPDKPQDPDKPRPQDPDKPRPNDPDKPRPQDPDKPRPNDPDKKPADPDKKPGDPDKKPGDPDKRRGR